MFWKPGTEAPGSTLDRDSRSEATVITYNPRSGLRLAQQRQLLPIYSSRNAVLHALEAHTTLVVVGETGSGKSTRTCCLSCENLLLVLIW